MRILYGRPHDTTLAPHPPPLTVGTWFYRGGLIATQRVAAGLVAYEWLERYDRKTLLGQPATLGVVITVGE